MSHNSQFTDRGSTETDDERNVNRYIKVCKETIHSHLTASSDLSFTDEDVLVDCDGFSVIVVVAPPPSTSPINNDVMAMPPYIKSQVKRLFKIFGGGWGKVKLPSTAFATKVKGQTTGIDHMFGGQQVKLAYENGHHCLYESEEVVIESPLKIAVHSSCSSVIAENIKKRHFPIELSPTPGICLNPGLSVPSFDVMLDIILDSCYVASTNQWIVHFGDIGTRHLIGPDRQQCSLTDLFKEITQLRNQASSGTFGEYKVSVEVTQIDISFNIPLSRKLARWSLGASNDDPPSGSKRKRTSDYQHNNHYSSLLGKQIDVWPLHGVESEADKILPEKQQKGTLRFKCTNHQNKVTNRTNSVSHTISDSDSIMTDGDDSQNLPTSNVNLFEIVPPMQESEDCQYHDTNGHALIRSIYETMDESIKPNFLSMHASRDDINSIKFYSTIAHSLLQNRYSIPLSNVKIQSLPKKSFRQLKAIIQTLLNTSKKAISYVNLYDVMARIEVSIRPGIDNENSIRLRRHGHLVDIFTLVCHSITEVFADHPIKIETVSPAETFNKLTKHVQQIQSMLHFRNTKIFDHVYRAVDAHHWLIALICYVMTLGGYAHLGKTRYLNYFLKNTKFDPFELKNTLIPEIDSPMLEDHTNESVAETANKILQMIPLSQDANAMVLKLISPENELSTRELFHSLNFRDKTVLAYHCAKTVLPEMSSQLFSKENLTSNDINSNEVFDLKEYLSDEFFDIHEEDDNFHLSDTSVEEIFDSHKYYQESTRVSVVAMHLGRPRVSLPEYVRKSNSLPNHPILYSIFKLVELCNLFSTESQGFINKLRRYINICHKHRIKLPNTSQNLKPFPENCPLRLSPTSSVRELHTIIRDQLNMHFVRSGTKDYLLKEIANHYFYPCSHTPEEHINSRQEITLRQEEDLNAIIHSVMNDGETVELAHFFSKDTRRFYRDNVDDVVVIPLTNYVFKPDPNCGLRKQFINAVRCGTTEIPLSCIKDVMLPNLNDTNEIIDILDSKLEKLEICDYFIDSRARVLKQFRPFLNWKSTKVRQRQDEILYVEQIVIPALSLVLHKHIAYVDNGVINFYYYQNLSNVVVLYSTESIHQIIPNQELDVTYIFKNTDATYCATCSQPEQNNQNFNVDLYRFATLHDDMNNLSLHPNGKPIKKSTLGLCLYEVMRDASFNHDQFRGEPKLNSRAADPLEIHDFITELAFCNVPIESCFDKTIIESNIFPTMQDFEEVGNNLTLVYSEPVLLMSVVCLKYKLYICMYTHNFPGLNKKCTTVFYYNAALKKVCSVVISKHVHFPRYEHIVYVSVSYSSSNNPTYKYWNMKSGALFPQKGGDYMNLLRTPYSYPDGLVLRHIYMKLRESGVNVYPADQISNIHLSTTTVITVELRTINSVLKYVPFVIFSFDDQLKVYPSCVVIDDQRIVDAANIEIVGLLDLYLSNNLNENFNLSNISFEAPESTPSSIITCFMYSYIACKSSNISDFISKLSAIRQLDNVSESWQSYLADLSISFGSAAHSNWWHDIFLP